MPTNDPTATPTPDTPLGADDFKVMMHALGEREITLLDLAKMFGRKENWTKIYSDQRCWWSWVGPNVPPYELPRHIARRESEPSTLEQAESLAQADENIFPGETKSDVKECGPTPTPGGDRERLRIIGQNINLIRDEWLSGTSSVVVSIEIRDVVTLHTLATEALELRERSKALEAENERLRADAEVGRILRLFIDGQDAYLEATGSTINVDLEVGGGDGVLQRGSGATFLDALKDTATGRYCPSALKAALKAAQGGEGEG